MGTTYPSGLDVQVTRDALGRIGSATAAWQGTTIPLADSLQHRPFGPIARIEFANGQALAKDWDQNYWPDAVTSPAFDYDFSTDAVGNVTGIDSSSDPARRYGYDRLDRLQTVRAADQSPIESWTHDATGNRTSRTAGGAPETYTYANTPPAPVLPGSPVYGDYSHRLQAVGASPRTYDAVGNTLTGIPALSAQNAQAEYDARNRLTGLKVGTSSYLARYEYNGRGERVVRHVGGAGHLFAYDESGQLLGRYATDAAPGSTWTLDEEIVWLENTPIASVRVESGQPVVRAILSDHLDSPRALSALHGGSQPAGTIVWTWSLTSRTAVGNNAFGTEAPNEDPDGNGAPIRFDLRFPGQQAEMESGAYYNHFRDYEPGTGRYVESDPIGLDGGNGTYEYANGNPINFTDPRALLTIEYQLPNSSPNGSASLLLDAVAAARETINKCQDCTFLNEKTKRILNAAIMSIHFVLPNDTIAAQDNLGCMRPQKPDLVIVLNKAFDLAKCPCGLASMIAHEAQHLVAKDYSDEVDP